MSMRGSWSRRRLLGLAGLGVTLAGMDPARAGNWTLQVGTTADPVTLDPAFMASYFENAIQYNLHEPLFSIAPDLTISPGMASVETLDARTFRLTLREGLSFHDGTPIDAAAAVFNFERMLDPASGSPRRVDLAAIRSVSIDGPLTFTLHLSSPSAPLLQTLALRAGMMVSPSAVRSMGADFASRSVGAGPYRVTRWNRNEELVLDRFDGYWRGPAFFDRIVFRPLADEATRVANLQAATVQLIDAVPPRMLAMLRRDPAIELKSLPGLGFTAFSFNMTRAPFNDARLRRAFAAAIDPVAIWRAVQFETGSVAHGPVPPTLAWARDEATGPAFDPAAARALVTAAAPAGPPAITITVTNAASMVRIAEILQAQARQVGLACTIRQVDPGSLISVLRSRDFDLALSPWSGRPDPDGNLFGWFTPDGPFNFAGYRRSEVADLLRRARESYVQVERAQLYRAAQRLIAEDIPVLFLSHPATIQASRADIAWEQFPDGSLHLRLAHSRHT